VRNGEKAQTAGRADQAHPENHYLYTTQCSLPVLAELVASTCNHRDAMNVIVDSIENGFFEPFATVVIKGLGDLASRHEAMQSETVSLPQPDVLATGKPPT